MSSGLGCLEATYQAQYTLVHSRLGILAFTAQENDYEDDNVFH